MSKVAFMFPGQGSYEAGMGREVAEVVPEAMAVFDAGSEASGLDLKEICFHGPAEARDGLLLRVDEALYAAKGEGRDRVVVL